MSKRTPGPWHCGGVFEPDSDRPTSNVWGLTPPGMQSGNIVCSNATIPDARLIAAAPELFALLSEAENLAAIGDIDETTEAYGWGIWMKATRAVLAKAGL